MTRRFRRSVVNLLTGWIWMRRVRRIRDTKRISYPDAEFSVHMLTCHRNVDLAIWCLKSFCYYAGVSPHITIHDDGTLTPDDRELLRHHLARCKVINRQSADEKMSEALKNHPLCRQMRTLPEFYCVLKLFDPLFFAQTDVIVLIDSDILFFKRPGELLDCAKSGSPCFNSDYQDAYTAPVEELRSLLGIDVFPRVNSGLTVLTRAIYDLDFLERSISCFSSPIRNYNHHEQTLHAVLLSMAGAHRLGEVYQISNQRIGPATVSHHFVNDGSRPFFYTRGIKSLKESGMFAAISG